MIGMQRLLVVVSLVIGGCASGTASRPASTTTGTPSPSAEAQDPDVTCDNEVRTGTHLEKKICRSQAEKDQDKRFVQDLYLNPSSRPN
jgi:hypothetical protein